MQSFEYLVSAGVATALTLISMNLAIAQTTIPALNITQTQFQPPTTPTLPGTLFVSLTSTQPSVLGLPDTNATLFSQLPTVAPTLVPLSNLIDPAPRPVSRSAVDLLLLNPDPDLLDLPTTPAAVNIDLNQPITLQQALELARRNNRDLQVVELQLRQSRAALREARAALYPTIGLQASVVRSDAGATQANTSPLRFPQGLQQQLQQQLEQELQQQRLEAQQQLQQRLQQLQQRLQQGQDQLQRPEFSQQLQQLQQRANRTASLPQPFQIFPLVFPNQIRNRGQVGSGISNTFNSSLAINYDIYTSGRRSAIIEAAQEQVRSAELEVERLLQQLRLDVTNDYYNSQQAEELIQVTQAAVENARISLRDAEALERAGLGTRLDVLQAQLSLADAGQNLNQALSLRTTSRRQLAQRLSLADTATISTADPVEISGRWPLSLEESIVQALQNRAELEQFLIQRNISQLQRRIALSSLRPQVSAFTTVNFVEQLDDNTSGGLGYAVGVQVNMNLFDGGAARARAAQEEANIAIAETNFANSKNQIRFEVEQAYSTLQSSFQNIQTATVAAGQARESLRLARLRFQAGVGTQLDVTEAQAALTQAQGNLVAAIINYNRALASIERSVSSDRSPPS